MSLTVPQRFITNLENFSWGEDWRATRIIKEKRVKGEYYFANLIRYYGEKNSSQDYDIGETMSEMAWLGRNEKFVGKRTFDIDHDSPTFGKRIYTKAITEVITETDAKGKPTEREILLEGKTIYEYTIPVTKENTEKMKELAGSVGINQETQFLFIYGATPPLSVDPETFWTVSVSDFLRQINPIKIEIKKDGKKI